MDMKFSYLQEELMLVKTNLEAIKATLLQMTGFPTLIMNIWYYDISYTPSDRDIRVNHKN
jgi:hypothetical protein